MVGLRPSHYQTPFGPLEPIPMTPDESRLLRFALSYPNGWHSFARHQPRRTHNALSRLEHAGLIEIVRYKKALTQFRAIIDRQAIKQHEEELIK
jgi:hypothetical protein